MDNMFSEKDILTQAIQDEKLILVKCGELLGESSCQELRRLITGIMTETQQLQFEYHNSMKNRGWLNRNAATPEKIQQLTKEMTEVKDRI